MCIIHDKLAFFHSECFQNDRNQFWVCCEGHSCLNSGSSSEITKELCNLFFIAVVLFYFKNVINKLLKTKFKVAGQMNVLLKNEIVVLLWLITSLINLAKLLTWDTSIAWITAPPLFTHPQNGKFRFFNHYTYEKYWDQH